MSRKHSQASANPKTSSSQQPTLTYAQLAGNAQPGNNSSSKAVSSTPSPAPPAAPAPAPAPKQNPPKSFSAAAKQDNRQRTPSNGAGNNTNNNNAGNAQGVAGRGAGAARGGSNAGARGREPAVRLPSRNSVSSSTTPNIQFGSVNQQGRPHTPPTAQKPASGSAATSGGTMPANMAKPASKPSFGSIQSHGEDSANANGNNGGSHGHRRPGNSNNATDGQARPHHGRHQHQPHHHHGHHNQQQQQQQRSASRSSSQGRQSQNYQSGGYKHSGPKSGPKPQEAASGDSAAAFQPHHQDSPANQPNQPQQQQPSQQQPQQQQPVSMPVPAPHPSAPMVGQQQQPPPQQQQQPVSHYGGSPYRGHVRPPHSQGHNGPYKPQSGAHYPQHHMGTQPMSQPMGYPMPAPGQPPMQQTIMTTQPGMPPMQGWMPPPQFAYLPMGAPGYEQYYRQPQGSGGPPPHSMYGIPNYSMPAPQHSVAPQMGPGGLIPGGPMSGAPMPGMTAAPMAGQQQPPHHNASLSANAQAFVPGRRPVRIVDPTTNQEVDISSQRLRSTSAASSVHQTAPSGTASPAPSFSAAAGAVADKRETSSTPAELSASEEPAKPRFKIPVNRAIKIVDPNLTAKTSDSDAEKKDEDEKTKDAASDAERKPAAETEAKVEAEAKPEIVAETKTEPETKAEVKPEAETKAEVEVKVTPAAEPKVQAETNTENEAVEKLTETLAATKITAEGANEESEKPAPTAAVEEQKVPEVAPAEVKEQKPEPVSVPAEESTAPAHATEAKAEENIEDKPEPVQQNADAKEQEQEQKDEEQDEDEDEDEDDELEDGEEQEEGEIDEAEESEPATPTPLTGRSRQVTFSEPATPSVRTLSAAEIIELYAGESAAPAIVGEILKYPRVFLERFSTLGKPPAGFHFEIASTDDRRSGDRGSGMRRSISGSGRQREQPSSSSAMSGFGGMGNFRHVNTSNTGGSGSGHGPAHNALGTSEERFRQSTNELKGRMDPSSRGGSSMGGRSPSGQYRGLGGGRESRGGRTGSRGRGRGRGRGGSQHGGDRHGPGGPNDLPSDVKPLVKSENRYVAKALRAGKNAAEDDMQEDVFHRHIQTLLNKLTPDNFDAVSDELLVWGNKSVKETDGRILRHLIMLVFDKATDEPLWASTYAHLCVKLILSIDPQVSDENVRNKEGNLMTGMQLVRKYLLTKCQEDFERGWKVEMPEDMESPEYYEAMKIKRRGLGLVKFIGELFLRDILSERIMHECIKRLLTNYESPEEEETESLSKLLTTAGSKLDHKDAKKYMDAYFGRVAAMAVNKSLASRIRFMLQDVIELRQSGWTQGGAVIAGPKTIAEIHEDAERAKALKDKMRRTTSNVGRRSESHAGRGDGPGGRRSGWNTVGGPSGSGRNEQNQRTGDMTGFGDISRFKQQTARTAGSGPPNPFSVLSGGSRGWRNNSSDGRKPREERPRSLVLGPGGRTPSHLGRAANSSADSTPATPDPVNTHNMFDALMNDEEESANHASPRVDPSRGGPKVPVMPESAMSSSSKPAPAEKADDAKQLDTATIQRKAKGMVDEYVQLKIDSEFVECFKELGEVNYNAGIFEIVNNLMDRRVEHVEQVAKGLALLKDGAGVSVDIAVAALNEYVELLEDIALDTPGAFRFYGMAMAALHVPLGRVAETLGELAADVSSVQPSGVPVVYAYLKHLVTMHGEEQTRKDIEEAQFDITQFFNKDKRSDAEVRRALNLDDLLPLFPKYA
ncbi:hypothetical protein GGF39_001437 [Coemansia sp. RSA 1721]|nr:hypothetical protein GGF39_001437 [Coemansia sp. RSA 1721]